ncbi:MAG: biopolymer transporter ExbD [Gammaproteobacteria bacterium]|nr:biopolymer transporter ExbD [Gammaproteobacteria bacterium]MDX5374458.1 biopolymer transporter ExbD [Gammaproteobacteria bacterium]
MNFRPHRSESVDINLTPLIDVVFLLLIFFMVTTTFDRASELKINLPQAAQAPEEQQVDKLELVIDASGTYFLNGNELVNTKPETVRTALEKAAAGKTDLPVIIRADANTPHQSVVTAMDAAQRAGLTRLSIATTRGAGD